MTPSLEGWSTKAKETPSPHEVRLAPLDTNLVFQSLEEKSQSLQNLGEINKSRSKRNPSYCFSYDMLSNQDNMLAIKKFHQIRNEIPLILYGSINQMWTVSVILGNVISP